MLGFAVSGVGETIYIDVQGGVTVTSGITENDDVVIRNSWGSTNADLSGIGITKCKSLKIECQANVTLPSTFEITNNFEMTDGSISNSVNLTVGGDATISGGTFRGSLSVGGNMSVTNGTLSATSISVEGNFTSSIGTSANISVGGDVTISNGTFSGSISSGDNMTVSGGTLSRTVTVGGNLTVSGGTLSVTTIDVEGNFTTSVGASGTVSVGGDVVATGANVNFETLKLDGCKSQSITGWADANQYYGRGTITNLYYCSSYTPVFLNENMNTTNSYGSLVCGAKVTSVSINPDGMCVGTTLHANPVAVGGTPTYQWKKNGGNISGATSANYNVPNDPSAAGEYKVEACLGGECVESEVVEISGSPTLIVSPSSITSSVFKKEPGQANQTETITVSGACCEVSSFSWDDHTNFDVTDNGNGTYTVTFKGTSLGDKSTTVTFDGTAGASSQTVSVSGSVVSCVGQNIASFDFDSQGFGTNNGITLSSPFSEASDQNKKDAYKIQGSNFFANGENIPNVSNNALLVRQKDANATVFSISNLDPNKAYLISMKAGSNAPYGDNKYEITIGNTTSDFIRLQNGGNFVTPEGHEKRDGTRTISGAVFGVSSTDITVNVVGYVGTNPGSGQVQSGTADLDKIYTYFDDIVISKICPPEVEITSVSTECESSASFTASATAGTGAIASYTWYVNGDVEATHTSSSSTDTFEPGKTLSNSSLVKVVVTDEYGITAEATYTINCGPDVNAIETPARICEGGDLTIEAPTVTPKAGTTISEQGWEYASSPTSNEWEEFDLIDVKTYPTLFKDKYIRYYAIDNTGKKGKSNAVQVTMFRQPEVGSFVVDDICDGGSFSLPIVGYTVYADSDGDADAETRSTEWKYSKTGSNFSTLNEDAIFNFVENQNRYIIRYYVTDECGFEGYSEATAYVRNKTITPDYTTYMRVAGMTNVVVGTSTTTSTCVGDLEYTITNGNDDEYFSINLSTGEITLTKVAPAGSYPMTVSVTDREGLTRTVNITVTLTATPTLTVDGCIGNDLYLYTNQPYSNVFNVGSGHVNGDIALSLSGSAATSFSLSQTSVDKNTIQNVTATLATPFTSAGDRTLTFTAHDSEGSDNVADVTCTTTIHVVELSLRDYVASQTSCNSTANTLRVVATGEDATNLPLTYQWYKDNVAIPGATSSSYTPTKAGSGNGAYHCVVSANGNVVHTTAKANISFVEGVPELTFNEDPANGGVVIPSEIFCSQEIGAVMKVEFEGNDVTNTYDRFWWINEHAPNMEGITETGVHSFSFDCSNAPYTAVIGAYIRDNASGCMVTITKTVDVKKMGEVYYYRGNTGDDSDVLTLSNWCTNATGACGSSPSNFSTAGCEYIINQNNVKLKSGQTWNVSGEGSKITIGDGNWNDFTSVGNDWQKYSPNEGYGIKYSYGEYIGTFTGQGMQAQMTKIADHDYRNDAKMFTIDGELNTSNGVKINVNTGSAVTITTTDGDFEFGTLATDKITHMTGNANGYYNIVVKPGSSVTYKGAATENIRSGTYSQLYIDTESESGNITFEQGADVVVAQKLKNETSVPLANINPNGSTVQYVGSVNQEVASLRYYNLQTESASDKTLVGDIEVTNSLNIGAGSTLAAEDNDITISGSGENAVNMVGHFDCGTSTFTYASADETTVAAMNYYNLNLGNGDRTLSNSNIIGIKKDLIAGTGDYTVTGSTVEFNGNEKQHIPAFTFYNLTINDTAMRSNSGSSFNEEFFLELDGNVEVKNNLVLTEGILRTNEYTFLISNPASSALGQGYRGIYNNSTKVYENVNKIASYINGNITRVLPENLSESSTLYYFPVGDNVEYKPLMLNSTTTTTNPQVTVGVEYEGVDGKLSDGTSVKTSDAWHVDGNSGYTSASVGVSISSGLGATINALAYGKERNSDNFDFEDIYGSLNDRTILYSQIKEEGYYALIHRIITDKTYYYDCSGGKDITDIESWHTGENGSGDRATKFDETDAKWIIKCGTTVSDKLTINGSNSIVEISIPKDDKLIINDTVDFVTATIKKGTVQIGGKGNLTVDYGFKMEDVADDNDNNGDYTNRSTLINNGRVNLYLADVVLTNSYIENNGYLYTENVNWDLSSPGLSQTTNNLLEGAKVLLDDYNKYHHTQFINNSKIEMINANLYVTDAGNGAGMVHVRNASNAVWLIDNTNKSGSSFVNFEGIEFAHSNYGRDVAYVDFQCNSTFVVKHADMTMKYKGNIANIEQLNCPAWIGGDITVEDGNMTVGRNQQGGGTFTLEQTCGNIYLKDTDNSGDGIFSCYGTGGYTINIAGTLYAMGVTVSGGASGSSFNVKEDGTVFIGNIGAKMPTYTWQFTINVEDKGTLYYCGNRSAGADNVGTNNGQLYYAGNYYYGTNPIAEQDFENSGNFEQMYASEEQCMAAYREGLPNTSTSHLMPVEITMLYGICIDENIVELRWQTASETDNSYFVILRSFDGVHFEEVDYIMGAGTTTEVHDYVFYDTDDNDGIVYYKLRQVDYDGNYTDSKVIAVQTCGKNARFSIGSEEIEVFFRNPQANYVVITSVTGQIFYSKKFTNVEEARIAVPQRKGIYIISVIDSKQITSEKFIR